MFEYLIISTDFDNSFKLVTQDRHFAADAMRNGHEVGVALISNRQPVPPRLVAFDAILGL